MQFVVGEMEMEGVRGEWKTFNRKTHTLLSNNKMEAKFFMQKKDTSLLEYSEVERGKEFEYPDSISGIPIFDGSFLSWGKPEDIIRNGKVRLGKMLVYL